MVFTEIAPYVFANEDIPGEWEMSGRLLIPVEGDDIHLVDDCTDWPSTPDQISASPLAEGTLFICRGLPGSGIEHEAERLAHDLDVSLFSLDKARGPFPDRLKQVRGELDRALYDGVPFAVLHVSAPAKHHIGPWLQLARQYNYQVKCLLANTPWRHDAAECIKRAPRVNPDSIRRMADELVFA